MSDFEVNNSIQQSLAQTMKVQRPADQIKRLENEKAALQAEIDRLRELLQRYLAMDLHVYSRDILNRSDLHQCALSSLGTTENTHE